MASKQGKPQQRNKQAAFKLPSQVPSGDPWSFLECIDAPKWVDLSLEASLIGNEGDFDSWFDRSHKHHVMSLAGLNSNMTWLRLGKSSQLKGSSLPRNNSRSCQKEVNKPQKKQSSGPLNKAGNGQSNYQSEVASLRVRKGVLSSENSERGSNAHRQCGSFETACTLSGHSSTSECETSRSLKKHSLCSDRSSVSSSLQAAIVRIKLISSSVCGMESRTHQSEDFYDDTPSSCIVGAQRSRNSSTASCCPPMMKPRYSSELGVSAGTQLRYSSDLGVSTGTQLRYSSDLGVSTGESLHRGCEADRQSSGNSVVTSLSGASQTSGEQAGGNACSRIWEEGTDDVRTACEVEDNMDGNKPPTRISLRCHQRVNNNGKGGIRAGRRRLETKLSLAGSVPTRRDLYAGKENAPPREGIFGTSMLQAKDKPFRTKAPLGLASSKTANAKPAGLSKGGGFQSPRVKKKEGPCSAMMVAPWKSGISQNVNTGRASTVAHQRKRSEAKQPPVACEKTTESERDLAALVAQHNQKIRSLGVQNCRKGFR